MGIEQRRHARVSGPFDGFRVASSIETPIRIYDLSVGGCFINWVNVAPTPGNLVMLRIDLPGEGWIAVMAETLYERPGGFAVRFTKVAADGLERLERALTALRPPSE